MSDAGQAFQVLPLENGLVELRFDLPGESVNKFNAVALASLKVAVEELRARTGLRGVLLTSGKDVFCVGADITEFLAHFKKSEADLTRWILETDAVFSALEDLDAPSVVAIDGVGVGGGFELCLSASYRAMSQTAQVGLPETKLGLFPGWGGTVRLSRLCGADTAIEWIAGGEQGRAADALKAGAVDAVTAPADLREAALGMLREAADGKLDWKARRAEKLAPLTLNTIEAGMVFASSKAFVAGKAGPHYPAPAGGDRGDREGRGQEPRRGAGDRSGRLREDREDEHRPRARERLPRRPGREADREEAGEGRAAGEARGGARRRDHGRRHLLPVGVPGRAGADEGHRTEGARGGRRRGDEAPREAGRAREAHDREDGAGPGRDHADALLRRFRLGRLRRRGRGRERGRQEEGAGRGRGAAARARDPDDQHLDDLRHAARDGAQAAGELLRDCTSSTRCRACRSSR